MNTISEPIELEKQLRNQSLSGDDAYRSHKKAANVTLEQLAEASDLLGKTITEVISSKVFLTDPKKDFVSNKIGESLYYDSLSSKSIGGVTK